MAYRALRPGIRALAILIVAFNLKAQMNSAYSSGSFSAADAQTADSFAVSNGFAGFGPYKGTVMKGVDTTTLFGKVMCGYQGWFGVPGDGSAGNNWQHWTKGKGPMKDGNAHVDLWPDVSELAPNELFLTDFTLPDGRPAKVFSSYERPTVLRHFKWMHDYGIDGVFVQRFAVGLRNYGGLEHDNTVLANCREGANTYGRTYAVMYDLSGLHAGQIETVMNDWRQLKMKMKITDDPAYLHHRGKPVVAIWGIGFSDRTGYTLEECRKLIQFLKDDSLGGGCTVMLGVPAHWRELDHDAVSDPALLEVLGMADVISPWTVGRYTDQPGAAAYLTQLLKPDMEWCDQHKIDYLPVVFPGFSWYNMNGRQFNLAPRLHGQFMWSQFLGIKEAGAKMAYVAMFDEVDEGTAIFKCANDVPLGQKSRFLSLEGLPSDYYLKVAGAGKKLLDGEIPIESAKDVTSVVPIQNNALIDSKNNALSQTFAPASDKF